MSEINKIGPETETMVAYQSTDPAVLRRRIMDPCIAKNEAEHWARSEIMRLRTLIDGLMKAVEPFALLEQEFSSDVPDHHGIGLDPTSLLEPTVGDLRRAREAYLKAKGV